MKKVLEWIDPSGWLTEHRFCWIVLTMVLVGVVWYLLSFPGAPLVSQRYDGPYEDYPLEWHQMQQYYKDHPTSGWCFISSLQEEDDGS